MVNCAAGSSKVKAALKEVRGVRAKGFTHLGLRENNEDFFVVDLEHRLFIVADGMGGHNAGEIPSSLAAAAVREYISKVDGGNPGINIKSAVQAANKKVFSHALHGTPQEGMGTTLTVLWIVASKAYVAHVGDSRAYVVRNGYMNKITSDHSLVQEMLENGGLSENEARYHPQRNILTRAIGIQDQAEVDLNEFFLEANDILLLCSDGLSSVLSDSEIHDIIKASISVEQAGSRLVNGAAQKGGHDNITAIIVSIDSLDL